MVLITRSPKFQRALENHHRLPAESVRFDMYSSSFHTTLLLFSKEAVESLAVTEHPPDLTDVFKVHS